MAVSGTFVELITSAKNTDTNRLQKKEKKKKQIHAYIFFKIHLEVNIISFIS